MLHENPSLYRQFHKPHHTFTAPFAISSHALHPVEMLLQSVGTMGAPTLWSFFCGDVSLQMVWLWLDVRQCQGVLDHTGYELPVDPVGWIPGVGGTRFHDDHHKYFTANYASVFSVIDIAMGTMGQGYAKQRNVDPAS